MFYVGSGPLNNFFNNETGNKYHSQYTIDENETNSQFVLLSKFIENNSIILDVGCSDGKYGGFLREKKNAAMYGIDINTDAVNQARASGMFEDVYLINLERPDANDPEYKRYIDTEIVFDYIILTDVLEHISNPTAFLLNATEKLKNGGKILISVPNVAHADIWLQLMNGTFNYTDAGILDNTHLKFFTQDSFTQWISGINSYYRGNVCFDCQYVGNVYVEGDLLNQIREQKPQLYQFLSSLSNYNTLQLLFVLTKETHGSKTPELDKLLALQKGEDKIEILFQRLKESELSEKLVQENKGLADSLGNLEEKNELLSRSLVDLKKEKEQLLSALEALEKEKESLAQSLKEVTDTLTAIRNSRSYRIYHFLRGK